MTVGNAEVDDDHRYLISLINAIEAVVNCGIEKKVLSTHLSELFAYTEKHFKRISGVGQIGYRGTIYDRFMIEIS